MDFDKFPQHGPAIIVANHQHIFDIAVIHCNVKPWIFWVAKKELVEKPVIGYLALKMGVLSVDRHKTDIAVAKKMVGALKNKQIIGIFPQGTRVSDPAQISKIIPKTGAVHFALRTKTPIIPIGIRGNYKLFSKIRVTVGDPVDFSQMPGTDEDKNDLMKKTIYLMTKIYELAGMEYKLDDFDKTTEMSL